MPTPSGQRLKVLAQANGMYIGYASASGFLSLGDTAAYQATAAAEYNLLTPENDMKWSELHPAQSTYDFTAADQHVTFAQQHGLAVHGHNLCWHQSNPSWLTGGSWTSTTLLTQLQNHIDTVVGHYAGQVRFWDVVNEAFNDDGSYRTDGSSIWGSIIGVASGSGYIEKAFQRAAAADASAILVYNDFSIATENAKSDAVYAMAQDFVGRGIPLHAIGMQMHVDGSGIDYASFAANMARFAALGLKVLITEMDVRIPASPSGTDLSNQAAVYQAIMQKCLLEPACVAFQTWGFTDAYSWIPSAFPGSGAALPFDATYTAKSAYTSLQAQAALGQGGTNVMTYLDQVVSRRPWSTLVRDAGNTFLTSGYGTYATSDYATAALSTDRRLGMVYLPVQSTVGIDLRKMRSVSRARWFDPSNGTFADVSGGPFVNDSVRSFTPSATNSGGGTTWVLVLESLDRMPGSWVAW